MKNYSGSDLSKEYKSFARKEFKRIKKILTDRGCSDVQLSYGFYFYSGFFTAKNGQIYYLSRNEYDDRILVRTASSYKDYTGGCNNFYDTELNNLSV